MKKWPLFITLPFLTLFAYSQEEVHDDRKRDTASPSEIMKQINREEKIKIDSIGILVYDQFFELDAVGPFQVLSSLPNVEIFYVAPKKGIVDGSSGMQIKVDNSIDEIHHLDILVVPGGLAGTVNAGENEKIINWIKKIDETSVFTTSVCTGSWILGKAGLLANRKATTNWYRAKEYLEKYDAVFVNERWVQDGKYWTSAGVSAGIDMSLALVAAIKGKTYAELVMLNLEYDPQPPFKGGSVDETDPKLVEHMMRIYDKVLNSH